MRAFSLFAIIALFVVGCGNDSHGTCIADDGGVETCTLTTKGGCDRISGTYTEGEGMDPANDEGAEEAATAACSSQGYAALCSDDYTSVASEEDCDTLGLGNGTGTTTGTATE